LPVAFAFAPVILQLGAREALRYDLRSPLYDLNFSCFERIVSFALKEGAATAMVSSLPDVAAIPYALSLPELAADWTVL